ncbi:nitrate/TMAO reductases, membrane-bound tetraheme cytochrome c subunit [Candidatus Scalindua japonica]|uniref:Nitrate/TMAO reductases, membrane-bound tetraheme cytochrome c subunit n=1 Tax=Candidatus Scalindua japonica TaxID=1284222 RepID=A0A286U3H8_9BACT|nr:cytochrome c [Candidatus Scalindua japonica]GAX62700.1 nitrate/TMAO reductases, membrane-bound tetraheme cytochrome c subunit [Candidatus Scalindua japonica]
MYRKNYHILALLIPLTLALFFGGCVTVQRLPEEQSEDAQVYIERCSSCHTIPHPSRLNFNHWKDKIAVMEGSQMPVIKTEEKEAILSYMRTESKKGFKIFKLRCGKCHLPPKQDEMEAEDWEQLIVVLDGKMPVFSEKERSSIIRYLQAYAKK